MKVGHLTCMHKIMDITMDITRCLPFKKEGRKKGKQGKREERKEGKTEKRKKGRNKEIKKEINK